jgi:hypothetical protein
MRHRLRSAAAVLLLLCASAARAAKPQSPSEFLGFQVGADRKLADYRQIASYFKALKAASPRVSLVTLGRTVLGEEMLMAVISSEENVKNLKRIREVAHKLADPRGLSDADAASLVRDGKVVLLVTCNIHATEIGASQMAMEWAYALAAAEDAETKRRLDNVVLLLVPSLNPDGQIMEAEWYRKNLGTPFEGIRLPWLYHHYTGHDNNRDWFQLTQPETLAMTRAVYTEWFPQVWLDEHQMGHTGPRIFVPPFADPVSTEIHPLVWREDNLIGAAMALRLEQAGKSGVIYGFSYDAYWPGGTMNTAQYKNVSGLLTEVASAKMATPVEIPAGELAGGRKGLIDYGPQTNFPNPWPGGTWRLRDIMDYERIASEALLETCADHRADFLEDMLLRARAAIGMAGPKDAYRIPIAQRDRASAMQLARIMHDHGVEVKTAGNGDYWIPLGQPYGRFVREMLGTQRYPEMRLVAGRDIVRPYDVAAWSMPLMMGVEVERGRLPDGLQGFNVIPSPEPPIPDNMAAFALSPGSAANAKLVNAAFRGRGHAFIARQTVNADGRPWPAGTIFLDTAGARGAATVAGTAGVIWTSLSAMPAGLTPLKKPRVGIYRPWTASMDEGWTRWVLEQYGFAPTGVDNKTIRAGKLSEKFDVIVLPDVDAEAIATGKPKREPGEMRYFEELPAEYSGGLEKEGAKALKDFVEAGGAIVALASSSNYVIENFNVPVRNVLATSKSEEFSCPGSLLRVKVDPNPLTAGLPEEMSVFVNEPIAFATTLPGSAMDRWVLATYPTDAKDVLVSGWIHGEDRLTRRAAAVAMTYGKGKLVLIGFRAQHRAQTNATFPFLFNALYWGADRP